MMLFEEIKIEPTLSFQLRDESPIERTGADGLTFRKQVLYVGKFGHYDSKTGKPVNEFDVSLADLHHWANSVKLQRTRGIKIDLPIGHTENPEASRGEVLDAEVAKDHKGRPSLFVTGKFADAEAAKLAKTAQVSIHSPSEWADGTGNTYRYPFRHLALTQTPVVPDTAPFSITASLLQEAPEKEAKKMKHSYKDLAKGLGIDVPEGTDDDGIGDLILSAGLVKKSVTAPAPVASPEAKTMSLSLTDPKDAMLINLSLQNRRSQITGLIQAGKITSAVGTELTAKFATQEAVTLSLSGTADGFDNVVSAMDKMPASNLFKSATGSAVTLSNPAAAGNQETTLAQRLAAKKKR